MNFYILLPQKICVFYFLFHCWNQVKPDWSIQDFSVELLTFCKKVSSSQDWSRWILSSWLPLNDSNTFNLIYILKSFIESMLTCWLLAANLLITCCLFVDFYCFFVDYFVANLLIVCFQFSDSNRRCSRPNRSTRDSLSSHHQHLQQCYVSQSNFMITIFKSILLSNKKLWK